MCPSDTKYVMHMLQHFENNRLQSPLNTKGLIVLPDLKSPCAKQWHVYLNKYQLIHTYPAGTFLFTTIDINDENENIKPISWPMNIFLADYTVEDRLHQSQTDAYVAADAKLNAVLTEMENRQFRTVNDQTVEVPNTSGRLDYLSRVQRVRVPKPHQPRFITETCHLSNQQENNPLLIFTTNLESTDNPDNKTVSTFLLDSGASRDFISQTEVNLGSLSL